MPQTEQIEKQVEELQQADSAAEERVRLLVEGLELKLGADQDLTLRDRYLTWGQLTKQCGFKARTEGRPY